MNGKTACLRAARKLPKGLALVVVSFGVIAMVCGCNTPPPPAVVERVEVDTRVPLTMSLWTRLSQGIAEGRFDLKKIQFGLSGKITLEREGTAREDGPRARGGVQLDNVRTREEITIPDQTGGQIFAHEEKDGAIILSVGFDQASNNTLLFSCRTGEGNMNEYFYLQTNLENISALSGEEIYIRRGSPSDTSSVPEEEIFTRRVTPSDTSSVPEEVTYIRVDPSPASSLLEVIHYAGKKYRVKYGENVPFLFIKLTQNDRDLINSQTLKGRTVE